MKKLIAVMILCSTVTVLSAEDVVPASDATATDAAVTNEVKNEVVNEGLDKQLRIMERTLTQKGIEEKNIQAAKRTCKQLCAEGYTPEECTQTMTRIMLQLKKSGELSTVPADTYGLRVRKQLKEKEAIKQQTQTRDQSKTQLKNEVKERARKSRPADKGGASSGSGNGSSGGSGTGTGQQHGGN